MNGVPCHKTFAAKGSALHAALMEKNTPLAQQIYKATTERFDAMYPTAYRDRQWFENWKPK